jgi:hypothetical protein
MAATQESNGTVFQAWLPHPLDKELREYAEAERRSLSQTIRLAVEDQLRQNTGEGPVPLGGKLSLPARAPGSSDGLEGRHPPLRRSR